ncbi:MAG: acyltransferase [Candidatus Poseidoniaceae archaeon]|jgi:acetyltransferase-like isoleucine patch superfamily enzyme|nr:acyltransferase [Candidatus Poseidoniaceae archaeon]
MDKLNGKRINLPSGATAWWPCHVSSNDIGTGTNIGALSHIGRNVTIGSDCRIQGGAYVADSSIIGDRVFIGPNATITNDRFPPSNGKWQPVVIDSDVVIGAGSTIVAGTKIGKNSVVAAGAVVTNDVEENVVVSGCPAAFMMHRDEYERRRA